MKARNKAIIMAFIVALIWGFAFFMVDFSLNSGFGPFIIIACRGLIAGIILLPFAIKNKIWKDKKTLLHSFICGVFYFVAYMFQIIGQMKSTSEVASFYTALYVIFTPFCALLLGRKLGGIRIIAAVIFATIGVFCLSILPSIVNGQALSFGVAEIMLLLCALFFALQIVWVDKFLPNSEPLSACSVMLTTLGVLSLIPMFISIGINKEPISIDPKGIFGLLYIGILASGLCSVFQFKAQKNIKPALASLIFMLETPFTFVFSWMMPNYGEKIHVAYAIPGLVFLLAGVIVSIVKPKKRYYEELGEIEKWN